MFHAYLLKQDWDKNLPKYWNDNSPFKTHFLNALSITLPDCEKFFIDTVKPHLKDSSDPDLVEFVRQEGYHRNAHAHYNNWLEEQGLPANKLQTIANRKWDWVRKHLGNRSCLAITICIEHITVVYASVFLNHEDILNNMHPHFREIWQWHAYEEVEHKAVTMNLWNKLNGPVWLKRLAMMLVLPTYMWYVGKNTLIFLHADKQLWKLRTWKDMVHFLFNKKDGVVRRSFVPWVDLMKADFHPNHHDHTHLLELSKI